MNYFQRKLPLTRIKIFGARILYTVTKIFTGANIRVVTRGGIRYEIDISEGIDLSVYLFGNFQNHLFNKKFITPTSGWVILDVGANFGIMSLKFADSFPNAEVHAFEPTQYALTKFQKNLSLNPFLASRIYLNHAFIGNQKSDEKKEVAVYSSWKINNDAADRHPVHLGSPMDTNGARYLTLDEYIQAQKLKGVDLIKIDTDGHEAEVIESAKNSIGNFRPLIIFEAGLYIARERGISFTRYFDLLEPFGYELYSLNNSGKIQRSNYHKKLPEWSTIDVIAVPVNS
ncbi:MAG: FkbM family methyltransferase [Cyclobacteriaceae bacterium]|nr:FkbM family methyltransferase [Cyclobacteriaceae bacterium]